MFQLNFVVAVIKLLCIVIKKDSSTKEEPTHNMFVCVYTGDI